MYNPDNSTNCLELSSITTYAFPLNAMCYIRILLVTCVFDYISYDEFVLHMHYDRNGPGSTALMWVVMVYAFIFRGVTFLGFILSKMIKVEINNFFVVHSTVELNNNDRRANSTRNWEVNLYIFSDTSSGSM